MTENRDRVGERSHLSLSPLLPLVDDFSEESSFYEILPCCARFRCGELVVEGQWHHLALLMSRGMLKNSTAALYIDGQLVSTVKVSGRTGNCSSRVSLGGREFRLRCLSSSHGVSLSIASC